ncbi:ARM repeat-containing protein [Coemansia reversa NRRL 1564]|uniref:ARM repeat-containing protein n=1 Tax=Coemansia reversa (strain ATCC 12441 / NRRL 1564) TaxID=763665 RepID=A0A2G5B3L9_COERN|nr:ARM repeat-containing protein [Coemansia reversa NRRL 1564]|eukprot:PIA13612.1 ARM repeat-containing protein [Coemansia reversa NRRL 1564]
MPNLVIPAALAKALSDKLYDKQRAATLKQKIYQLVAELSTDYATSEKEAARIGGLVALAATAVALTHINIRPFLPHMVPPMVSALSDGESKVRYFACESLYNVAKVSRGHILRWFNDIFDGLARVTADSVKTVKDGADYLDRLIKDIVAEQAATCIDWYESDEPDALPHSDAVGGNTSAIETTEIESPGVAVDSNVIVDKQGVTANETAEGFDNGQDEIGTARRGPRLAFSLEKFVPLLAERMHTYKPSTRLYLIEWVRVLDSVPGVDLIIYLPEFLDGLLRFLSDSNEDVRNKTQSLLGELLNEIRECVELQNLSSEDNMVERGILSPHSHIDTTDDSSYGDMTWRGAGSLSRARVRSSTIQSDIHVEGRFSSDTPRVQPYGLSADTQQEDTARSSSPLRTGSRLQSRASSITGGVVNRAVATPFGHRYQSATPVAGASVVGLGALSDGRRSRANSRGYVYSGGGSSGSSGDLNHRSATGTLMSSALTNGQLHGMTDELRMAARRKKIRAVRAGNALIPGGGVMIDFARCVDILIPHIESNEQEIQGAALSWIYQFTWLCPEVIVASIPQLVNAVLPSVSHPISDYRRTAEDLNDRLYSLVRAAPDPKRHLDNTLDDITEQPPVGYSSLSPSPQQQRNVSSTDRHRLTARPLSPIVSNLTTASIGNQSYVQQNHSQEHDVSRQSLPVDSAALENENVVLPIPPTRSRAGSLLQASGSATTSAAPSRVATPPPAGTEKRPSTVARRWTNSTARSPSAESEHQPQHQLSMPLDSTRTAAGNTNEQQPYSPVPPPIPTTPRSSSGGVLVAEPTEAVEPEAGELDSGSCPAEVLIQEPFNYEQAATAVMELFAKNVHEPTKVAGMHWLLLLHRKAPWRILTPDDMSFPVLLKMLGDSSEQVVRLDLELFAQISLYSHSGDEQTRHMWSHLESNNMQMPPFDVDPRSMPYLARFLGSLLQMFATDRALLETRGALMVRQLCVVLDAQLVFCLLARLLVLPHFSIESADAPPESSHNSPNTPATGWVDDSATAETAQQQNRSGADEGIYQDYASSSYAEDENLAEISESVNGAEGLADLEFISVMVQHLSWILVTAPETEVLRLTLRKYNANIACHMPQLPSLRFALFGSRLSTRDTAARSSMYSDVSVPDDVESPTAVAAARRGRRPVANVGGRTRGDSGTGLIAPTPVGTPTVTPAAVASEQKPSKLVRSSAAVPASAPTTAKGAWTVRPGAAPVRGGTGSRSRGSTLDGDRARGRQDLSSGTNATGKTQPLYQRRQQQQKTVQGEATAETEAKAERARGVLSQAVECVQSNIMENQQSHGLFTALFRTWSHNPAACLTLCLLSQHYEVSSELIHIFGRLTQDLTVSFLVQLDKLVQLIESPVFTFVRLQLLDPLLHPLLIRTLYGLLMMLPQSSAFAILRNRLSTVAMLPSAGNVPMQMSTFGVRPSSDTSDSQQAEKQQLHYHYHFHNNYSRTQTQPKNGNTAASLAQLGNAMGVVPTELGELLRLLATCSQLPSSHANSDISGNSGLALALDGNKNDLALGNAAKILRELSEIMQSGVASVADDGMVTDMNGMGNNSICASCAADAETSGILPLTTCTHGSRRPSNSTQVNLLGKDTQKLLDDYRSVRRRHSQALLRSQQHQL